MCSDLAKDINEKTFQLQGVGEWCGVCVWNEVVSCGKEKRNEL